MHNSLREHGRCTGTDCTDGLPHYLESLICMNIWNEKKKLTQTFGHANIKVALACVVQKVESDACHCSSSTLKEPHTI